MRLELWGRRPASDQASASPDTRRGLGRLGAKLIPLLGTRPGALLAHGSPSSPQPDPQRPKLPTPKVNQQQQQHDTSRHAREIESAPRVEMTHVMQSSRAPVAAYHASVLGLPRCPTSQCWWALKKTPATPSTIRKGMSRAVVQRLVPARSRPSLMDHPISLRLGRAEPPLPDSLTDP
jgi:hypothetical protein